MPGTYAVGVEFLQLLVQSELIFSNMESSKVNINGSLVGYNK